MYLLPQWSTWSYLEYDTFSTSFCDEGYIIAGIESEYWRGVRDRKYRYRVVSTYDYDNINLTNYYLKNNNYASYTFRLECNNKNEFICNIDARFNGDRNDHLESNRRREYKIGCVQLQYKQICF